MAFLAAVLLLAIPAAQAQTVVFDTVHVLMTPAGFDAELRDQQIADDRARSLREYVDTEHGDGDGSITEAEHEAYRQAEIERFNSQIEAYGDGPFSATSAFGSVVRVEDKGPTSVLIRNVTLSPNVIGETASSDTIQRHIDARLAFRPYGDARANVSFQNDFRVPFRALQMEWVVAHFTGAGNWEIDIATLQPAWREEFWNEDRFVVPYEETFEFSNGRSHTWFDLVDTNAESLKSDDKGDKKGSPGAPVMGLAFAMVALAALARRRL